MHYYKLTILIEAMLIAYLILQLLSARDRCRAHDQILKLIRKGWTLTSYDDWSITKFRAPDEHDSSTRTYTLPEALERQAFIEQIREWDFPDELHKYLSHPSQWRKGEE